jgi:hypothetical protein
MSSTPEKNTLRSYFELGDMFKYFVRVFKKQETGNFNLRMMHGINKVSILMFLFALVFWTFKRLFM